MRTALLCGLGLVAGLGWAADPPAKPRYETRKDHDPDGIGNGTHIHFSLRDTADQPVMFDPDKPWRMGEIGEHFCAGILEHLPLLTAVTAPSVASYYRLRPNRWAPTWANIGLQDRGAALRICPIFDQPANHNFNVEYRGNPTSPAQ